MIIYELSGCGGLFEKHNGGLVTLHKGELIWVKDGLVVYRGKWEGKAPGVKALKGSEIFDLFVKYHIGAEFNVTVNSRHSVSYDERTFEWDERFITLPEKGIRPLALTIDNDYVKQLFRQRRPVSAVDKDSSVQGILYRVINNTFN